MENWLSKFQNDGFCVIENFLSNDEIRDVKNSIHEIVEKLNIDKEFKSIFTTYNDDAHAKDAYFLESVDKIRYFYEEGAFDSTALHWLHPTFRRVTFSNRVQEIFKKLDFILPVIPQSMYIFKQPNIGGIVTPHIDGTFLLAQPANSVVGVWLAIDDATLKNGCLWFVPGSHKENSVHRKFVRTGTNSSEGLLKFVGTQETPDATKFVAVPVPKGSCVLISGLVWHKSEANTSSEPRQAYTFHVFDQGRGKWDENAWLQPTENYAFPPLFGEL